MAFPLRPMTFTPISEASIRDGRREIGKNRTHEYIGLLEIDFLIIPLKELVYQQRLLGPSIPNIAAAKLPSAATPSIAGRDDLMTAPLLIRRIGSDHVAGTNIAARQHYAGAIRKRGQGRTGA